MDTITRAQIILALFIFGCKSPMDIDIQGHRGARGLMPENTVPAFRKALDYGVTTLEPFGLFICLIVDLLIRLIIHIP